MGQRKELRREQKAVFYLSDEKKPDESVSMCYEACRETIEAAEAEGRTTNYGCTGFWPLDEPIPWTTYPGKHTLDDIYAVGRCTRDNNAINLFADLVIDALPIIAQVRSFSFFIFFTIDVVFPGNKPLCEP